ncbi:MAG: hypothetical protein QM743_14025 [Chitinophagaceae bacterium]
MQVWKEYIDQNKDRFLEELFTLLRIPSISADSAYKPDVARCAEAVKQSLIDAGVDKAEVLSYCRTPDRICGKNY